MGFTQPTQLYKEEAQLERYTEFSQLDELGQAAEYSKLLDKVAAIEEEKQAKAEFAEQKRRLEESNKRIEHNKNVNALLKEYGVDSEVDSEVAEKPKKKWWQIF